MTEQRGSAVLVCGAASGIGAAYAALAVERGTRVLLSDRDPEGLRRTAQELDSAWEVCDVTDPLAVERLTTVCVERLGGLDGLVNAAGVAHTRPLLDIGPDEFDHVVDVNLRGAFFLQQAVARRMVTAETGGSIVNFASTAGRVGRPLASVYAMTKAAILNLTRSSAVALAPYGIRVNAVAPGIVETPMLDKIRLARAQVMNVAPEEIEERWSRTIPLGRLGTPEEVAAVVAFLLSDDARYVTGEQIGVTGGTDGS